MFYNIDVDIDCPKRVAADLCGGRYQTNHHQLSTGFIPNYLLEFKSSYSENKNSVTQVPQYEVEGQRLSCDNLNLSIGCLRWQANKV